MRRSSLIVLLTLCSLGACAQREAGIAEATPPNRETTVSPPPGPPQPPGDAMTGRCRADAAQAAVGQPGDEAHVAAARAAAGARAVRVIKPGEPVTMDYSPDRLNVDLDAQGRIAKLHCG